VQLISAGDRRIKLVNRRNAHQAKVALRVELGIVS
jgi:hypothetical protein